MNLDKNKLAKAERFYEKDCANIYLRRKNQNSKIKSTNNSDP